MRAGLSRSMLSFGSLRPWLAPACAAMLSGCVSATPDGQGFDILIRGGMIYDGSGGESYAGDVAVRGDRIVAVGNVTGHGVREIDATGMAVAPGFINMLSWATESLIEDGRGMSDIKQGVTLEVFGEGWSMGPFTDEMKRTQQAEQGDIRYPIEWTSLGDYLEFLEARGVSPNVASFVGATTVRIHELGEGDVDPTAGQLTRMRGLVREAMEEGALGVGSSLIYAPSNYAETAELVALAEEAGRCDGLYISHMRSEGNGITEAIDELTTIAREANIRAEIYHLKEAGRDNWGRLNEVIAQIETARDSGLDITADMYTYTAGGTGLDATMPPWVKDGGREAMLGRLRDPAVRARVLAEMRAPGENWENLLRLAGGADNVLLIEFSTDALKPLTGKTLAEVAEMRGITPEEAAIDLVIEDNDGIGAAFFLMSEDNVRRQVALPWMSFGSDADAPAIEGVFLESAAHPRAYGNFARLLGHYVREEGAVSLAQAIHGLTMLPATNLRLRDRGSLAPGNYADIVVFDPETVTDTATYEDPHQYSTGMRDVFINGVQALADGEHTGAASGRFLHGPGWTGWPDSGACEDD